MDVVMTKDGVVLVSHEPWFSKEICDCDQLAENNIFLMTYDQVKKIQCGNKAHPKFPKQKQFATYKPSLIDVIEAVEKFCVEKDRPMPRFNIELKSEPAWDGIYLPDNKKFVERVYQVIRETQIEDLTTIQSFDPRVLNIFMGMKTNLRFAFLTESNEDALEQMLTLKKLPQIFSPKHTTLTKQKVEKIQKLGMQVIPWVVNSPGEIEALIEMGVDAGQTHLKS